MSISVPLISFIDQSMLTDEQTYLDEWQNSSQILFYSVLFVGFFTLLIIFLSFLYIHGKTGKNVHFLPFFSAILAGNFVLLGTLVASVIVENSDVIYDTIPGVWVCKMTAFSVNSSSCFIHWTWVAMYADRFCYIFFPFRFRRHSKFRTKCILCTILLISMCFQLWTPILITGRRLDSQFDNIYCAEDPRFQKHFQLIMVLEVITTFFLPLTLTIFADISVLTWKTKITMVTQNEISSKTSDMGSRKHSHIKIVSENCLRNSLKRRSHDIRRCLISATITMILNFPNYSLQVLDEFFNLRESGSIDVRRMFLRVFKKCF
ncbi:G-protein coupled receptors family 1 profile domain-containing protein [Caenorhabditis elegans]|uniref:G-protein coupled receptors family 1 profile domain-containing protein n=1 Tax=Caenorhabditis elegans TaxID=6239 RepID=Q9XVB5_CAEEL|nr:G-protein coupled receptors family 1 profile domain-containing protein [Caenorhabditis elegans]CAB04000.1 G-protein coupled receptors family 1 profile domain-containing protein [Caenorhabditis elegans]|eukprot:NP_507676.1 Uncharacterized protein CELE_C54E10.3 [Caenorhabditis elegans]